MLLSYDPSESWTYPTGCQIKAKGECPPSLLINYNIYPDALLNFLKDQGYISRQWYPTIGGDTPRNYGADPSETESPNP